jgi:hypothetical protein
LSAVLAVLAAVAPGAASAANPAQELSPAQHPAITPKVSIDQTALEQGRYPLRKVLESGGEFFQVPYLPYEAATGTGDGYGEGKSGPRNAQRLAFYPEDYPSYRFLRVNGLDSQSCYECHNSVGLHQDPAPSHGALERKRIPVGGSGGSNSNAFINPDFPYRHTYLVRNPPHIFGTGYTQTLGEEMTTALTLQRMAARMVAQLAPGKPVSLPLQAKGTSFGTFTTTYTGGAPSVLGCASFSSDPNPTFGEKGFTDDYSRVEGVACDLVIRPFQWKGIASTVRHFARDALDFHFSMQAVEKYGQVDCDKDGKVGEMTLGNVSALAAFATMLRPPAQVNPGGEQEVLVRLGEQIFKGKSADPKLQARLHGSMCATCHTPSLTVEQARLVIDNPGEAQITEKDCESIESGLVAPLPAREYLPVVKRLEKALASRAAALKARARGKSPHQVYTQLLQSVAQASGPASGYTIDLTQPGADVPDGVLPRLPAQKDGRVAVPLFSDLKLHDMGEGLRDVGSQGADVAGVAIPPALFLTRPLWGVGDTQPWLHDGRALTLKDAILLHESKGSEANPIIQSFRALQPSEQQAVLTFLVSLRLPPPGTPPALTQDVP